MGERYLFTSESVTEGHPDKLADQVSDAVLDAMLAQDPESRVACETLVAPGMILVAGEVTSRAQVDVPALAREVACDIGYTDASYGLDGRTCAVLSAIGHQSLDIARGVDTGGAGDQGMMFGYATRETPELMPLPITLAHRITRRLAQVRREGILPYLRPDGKSQVTVEYVEGKPQRVHAVVVAAQHAPDVTMNRLRADIEEKVIRQVIPPQYLMGEEVHYFINQTGRFEMGGPQADCGLTGRKIIVDTYGGVGAHGGGAFSGKDPTKVDRSASYMARHVAKCVVAAGLADICEVQLAYAIGVGEPVSVMIECRGHTPLPNGELSRLVRRVFELTPRAIIERLALRRPIYRRTAAYGHFGRDEEGFTWEEVGPAAELRREAELL